MRSSLKSSLLRSKIGHRCLGLLAFTALGAWACDGWGPRIYTAQAYDPDASCLAGYAPLGLVEADELGASCDPVCLRLDETLYISTVCPPYPSDALVEDARTSPDCALALGLREAEVSCDAEETPEEASDASTSDAAP